MERASCLRRKRDYVAHKVILRTTFLPGVGPSGCNFLCVSVFIPKKHFYGVPKAKRNSIVLDEVEDNIADCLPAAGWG